MEPQLVEKIVHEVKSQGVFDEFRKDSMADVDTKPAYQNLRQRVENTVRSFLAEQTWTPETNKNQLRERLRRHITESGFLDVGVERIVDQVVNPKVCTIFQPRIEDIAYKYLRIPLPPPVKPPPPLIHPLPPLPLSGSSLNVDIANSDLLPTDLEQVSPDSDKATVKSEIKEETLGFDDDRIDDEDESPPFEPVGKCKSPEPEAKNNIKLEAIKMEIDTELNGPSVSPISRNSKSNNDADETQDTIRSIRTAEFDSEKDASRSLDAAAIQESQLSQVSSDSQISHTTLKANELDDEKRQSSGMESAACNISEEAQMPKFNENSSDNKRVASEQLHFDINKDEIKFEGTERKSNITPVEPESAVSEEKPNENGAAVDKVPTEEFRFNAVVEPSQLPSERSVCSSQDDSSSMHLVIVEKPNKDLDKESSVTAEESSSMAGTQPQTQSDKIDTMKQISSSAAHKKHSKDKYRSHDRERTRDKDKDKDKDRQKDAYTHRDRRGEGHKSRERDRSKDKHGRSSKHSSSSSKHSSSTTTHRQENISGSKSDKSVTKSSHSSSSSSCSRGEKRNDGDKNDKSKNKTRSSDKGDRKSNRDDHFESKEKPSRRRSTDSNDEDKSSTTPASTNTAVNNTKSKTKSSSEANGSSNSNSTVKGSTNCNTDTLSTSNIATSQHARNNRVVILNEILENPATSFIAIKPDHMEVVMTANDGKNTTNTSTKDDDKATANANSNIELHFFEKRNNDNITSRISEINSAVDNCRQIINSLWLEDDQMDDKLIAHRATTRNNKRTSMMATLHVVDCQLDYTTSESKRSKEESQAIKCCKLSPTTSETSSGCSKENEDIDKNAMNVESGYFPIGKQSMANKSNQQQRYSNEDLYKPRPIILSQRSKRRAVVVDSFI